ncbi:MAG: hypothetical protein HQK56_21010 [Deltaproteobacteria bacterium]|nr:hypothetical protein [Deltaproteobacteria bacterium]
MSDEDTLIPSIQYIPPALKGEPLYVEFCSLLDGIMASFSKEANWYPLPEDLMVLLPGYGDERAVSYYFNAFIKPIYGTRLVQDILLDILEYDAVVKEWFQTGGAFTPYKFVIEFNDFPSNLDLDAYLNLVFRFKNERSRLALIHQLGNLCSSPLILSGDARLGSAVLGDYLGSMYRGVKVCIFEERKIIVDDYPDIADTQGLFKELGRTFLKVTTSPSQILGEFKLSEDQPPQKISEIDSHTTTETCALPIFVVPGQPFRVDLRPGRIYIAHVDLRNPFNPLGL